MTTNCIIEPRKSYRDRLFTLNDTGWPGVHHLKDLSQEVQKVVDCALEQKGFDETATQKEDSILTVGFGRDVLLANADKVRNWSSIFKQGSRTVVLSPYHATGTSLCAASQIQLVLLIRGFFKHPNQPVEHVLHFLNKVF